MNNEDDQQQQQWGTWEDLLLAFAVNRHGSGAWDSIAVELQKRTSASMSAQSCRVKYLDLRRRYGGVDGGDDGSAVALLEELRKVRVEELRREVERYDLNIESLETKMKSMAEERQKPDQEEAEKSGEEERKVEEDSEKVDSTDLGSEKAPKEAEPVAEQPDEDLKKPVRADSCNGSSNSIEKETNRNNKSDSGESNELVKENSDVQSSASRSREEGDDMVVRGNENRSGGGVKVEEEELTGEARWFFDFVQAVRSCHKFGSVVERRLRSQESSKYQKLILQHMDLDTIETRIKEGWYSGSKTKFFRDLLLLVNNALVYFNKNTPDAKSASEARLLISKEMSPKSSKSDSSSGKQASLQSLSAARKDEPMLKPGMCRKRTSITKASASSEKKKEQSTPLNQEKDAKPQNSGNSEDRRLTKKRTRDRVSPPAPTKKNSKTPPKSSGGTRGSLESGKQPIKGGSSSHSDSKTESKKTPSTVDSKKRLNFFKDDSRLVDALKSTPFTSEKKNETAKRGEKKEPVSRRGSETRQVKEKGSPEKKNIGRPPKRGAPPPPSLGKRGRDRGEADAGGGSSSKQQPRKRTRKV